MEPVRITSIVDRLEREAAGNADDPRHVAAQALKLVPGWERRTLIVEVDKSPPETVSASDDWDRATLGRHPNETGDAYG